jgi:all-trans-retinol 13,14-reductase
VRCREPAFDFAFPQGWEALEQKLCVAFPQDGQELKSLLARMKELWEQGRAGFVQDCGRSLGALFAGDGCSVQQAIDRCTSNPVLRGLLSSHGILYGVGAPEASLVFHSQVVGSYYESACFLEGGGRLWVQTLERALREAGVELRCGRGVCRIEVDEQGGFAAVGLATGERLTARRGICTVHPKIMLAMVPPQTFSPAYRRRVRALEDTPSAIVLFGQCPSARLTGNLILAREPHTLAHCLCLPLEDRPLFVSSPTSSAAGGVSVICPATLADVPGNGAGGRPEGYGDWKMEVARRLLQRLTEGAGDLVGRFELLDVATPLTFRDRLNCPEGGLYGVKHRLVDLPLLPRTAVKGLYLSGQAVVAPGVLGAMCASFLTESCII